MRCPSAVLAAAVLSAGCGDSSGPTASSFAGRLTGARILTLSGTSNGGTIFTEDHPDAQFAMRMFDERGDTVFALVILCPGGQPPAPGPHAIAPGIEDCNAIYSRSVVAAPSLGGLVVLESAEASTGRVTIGDRSGDQVPGTFSFTGPLLAGTDSVGTISASGSFSAQVP